MPLNRSDRTLSGILLHVRGLENLTNGSNRLKPPCKVWIRVQDHVHGTDDHRKKTLKQYNIADADGLSEGKRGSEHEADEHHGLE